MLTLERTEINDWVYDDAGSDVLLEAKGHARGHFGQFVRGERVDDYEFMKRVEDRRQTPWSMSHGVWALRPRFKPQHRYFGLFATYNWFVVLNKESRDRLEQSDGWHGQIDKSLLLWQELFPGRLPHVLDTLSKFMSNAEKCDDRW